MSLIAKFATVGGSTMVSRVLGFAREALIAATLGAGQIADAFYAAFGFPNLFRRILAEGAFNSAFIPLFAKELEGDGQDSARDFAEQVLSVLLIVLLLLSGLCMAFMPSLTRTIIAPGFDEIPEKFATTVDMARIMFPYLACMSLAAMLSGILNSLRKFFVAAILPTLLNVVLVAITLYALLTGAGEITTGYWLAWGVTASGILQLLLVYWEVKRNGFALKLRPPKLTPQVKRLLILMGPAILTGGVVQINIMVGRIIASAQDGAIALLNYADRINQLPLGVIGIAIGVVLLPELSRALKADDQKEVQSLQNRSMEFALLLTLPAAVGFIVMAEPIVNILYERGAFDAQTTQNTAAALVGFASGLPAYVLLKVFLPAYFAREDMKTPLYFSILAMVINIGFSLAFFGQYGHVAIAYATSVAAWVQVACLAFLLWRSGAFRPSAKTLRMVSGMVLACAIMGNVLYFSQNWGSEWFGSEFVAVRILTVAISITVGAMLYFSVIFATGGLKVAELRSALRR